MKKITALFIFAIFCTNCAYLPARYDNINSGRKGFPDKGGFSQNKYFQWENENLSITERQMAIAKMDSQEIFYNRTTGYLVALINEDRNNVCTFQLNGTERKSFEVGPKTILVTYLLPGLYQWRVSNGIYMEGSGTMTVSVATHFVDVPYYIMQKKFIFVIEDVNAYKEMCFQKCIEIDTDDKLMLFAKRQNQYHGRVTKYN